MITVTLIKHIEPQSIITILEQQRCLPYDYIRGVEKSNLFSYFLKDIMELLKKENSLCFLSKIDNTVGGFLITQILKWDSDIFGFPCARIKYLFSIDDPNHSFNIKNSLVKEMLNWAKEKKIKFIDCHLHPLDLSGINSLTKNGFEIIATHIHHVWDFRKDFSLAYVPKTYVKFANIEDLPLLESISPDIIPLYNRFNLDEKIRETGKVPILFNEWLKNSLLGRAKCVLLAIEDNRVVGYTTVVVDDHSHDTLGLTLADVELTGVVPNTRNKGIYRDMIITAVNWAKANNIDIMEGVIHICNAPANVVPPQLNARVLGAHHTFHWHAD